jgi:protein arginine kinase
MKEKAELPTALLEHTPWENEVNPIWPASSFLLHRNLSQSFFPPKLNETEAVQVLGLLKEAFNKATELKEPTFLKAELLSPLDKEFLFEHFLCQESFQNTLAGQALVVDDSARFLALFNVQDHIQLQLIDCQNEWEKTWNRLVSLEAEISNALNFAYSSKFGYLTADPSFCGTGLQVFIYLHVPALIHTGKLQEALLKNKDENVLATSMEGSVDDIAYDLLVLRNPYTLGLSEENILHDLQSSAMKLMALEKTLRTHLKQENNAEIKDQVSRAYGLLLHSYQLHAKETLSALSLIKLGLDLGWIEGITDNKLNDIFFKCRRAHLSHLFQDKAIDPQELPRKRAEYIHQSLQGIKSLL